MDERIIENWNSVVKESDTVYHTGDFAWCNHAEYSRRLNGNLYLVKGNHDYKSNKFYIEKCKFNSIIHISDLKIDKMPLTLCHYPMLEWNKSHFNSWHLYSHPHGGRITLKVGNERVRIGGKMHDVSVDNNNFTPIEWEDIRVMMKEKPDNINYIQGRR